MLSMQVPTTQMLLPVRCALIPRLPLVRLNCIARYYAAQPAAVQSASEQKSPSIDAGPSTPPAESGGEQPIPAKIQHIVEQIAGLSLLEVADLNKVLKKRLNIPDAPMMPAYGVAVAPKEDMDVAAPKAAETTKISFNVKLTGYDEKKKIELIKKIRDIVPNLNLVQAKKVVEGVPVDVKTDVGKTEADDLKKAIEAAGGKAEVV